MCLHANHGNRTTNESIRRNEVFLCILYISEIGLPVPHVAESSKHICEAFDQEIWRKDEKQFAAVGGVEGLFILIETSRLWFPDERIPGVFPTLVKSELDNQAQLNGLLYQIWSTAKVPM